MNHLYSQFADVEELVIWMFVRSTFLLSFGDGILQMAEGKLIPIIHLRIYKSPFLDHTLDHSLQSQNLHRKWGVELGSNDLSVSWGLQCTVMVESFDSA